MTLPLLLPHHDRIDLDSELLLHAPSRVVDTVRVRIPHDEQIDVSRERPRLARIPARPGAEDVRLPHAAHAPERPLEERLRPECLSEQSVELPVDDGVAIRPDDARPPDALADDEAGFVEPRDLAVYGRAVDFEVPRQIAERLSLIGHEE